MPTKRITHKLCCGSKAFILEVDKPIRKSQIDFFKQNGYDVPSVYADNGIFYAKKGALVATCAFGVNRVQLRCGTTVKESEIDSFQEILEKAVGTK